MRKIMAVLPLFFLSGCAFVTDALAPPYVPVPIHIYDQVAFDADKLECAAAGTNWQPRFSLGNVLTKTFDGATSNTSLIPISPLVPVYGAVGGAASAASDGLDVMSREHANVFRNCLRDTTLIDHSAVLANPN